MNKNETTADYNLAMTYHKVFSPAMLNEAIFSVSGFRREIDVPATGLPDVIVLGFPQIGPAFELPLKLTNDYLQWIDNFSWFRRPHALKFGFDAMRTPSSGSAAILGRGVYVFAGLPAPLGTASALENFRLGRAASFTQYVGDFNRSFLNWDINFYAADEWRIRPNVTVNLGLRYEAQLPPRARDVASGKEVFEAFDRVSGKFTQWNADRNNWSPFLGIAWDPSKRGTMALRAGYRLNYDRLVSDNYNVGATLQPPFVTGRSTAIPQVVALPFGRGPDVAAQSGVPVNLLLQPNTQLGMVHSWHATAQRDWGRAGVAELGYRGSAGRNLSIPVTLNRIDPVAGRRLDSRFGAITLVDSLGYSNYHALTGAWKYQARKGLTVSASYTWSKALDVIHDTISPYGEAAAAAAVSADALTGAPALGLEYGPAVFDRRHAFSASFVYLTPRLEGSNAVAKAIAGSWELSGTAFLQSGNPFSVLAGADLNQDGLTNDRPDLIAPAQLGRTAYGDVNRLIPRAAFDNTPGRVRVGTLGRNTLRRDGVREMNLRVARVFRLRGDRLRLQFGVEFFNLTNTVRFSMPVNVVSSPAFGRIQNQDNAPRNVRLGLKMSF
jgi:hypothetical protein